MYVKPRYALGAHAGIMSGFDKIQIGVGKVLRFVAYYIMMRQLLRWHCGVYVAKWH